MNGVWVEWVGDVRTILPYYISYLVAVKIPYLYPYLRFRLRQFFREASRLGVGYLLLLSVLVWAALCLSYRTAAELRMLHFSLPLLLPALSRYARRKDVVFLKKLTTHYRVLLAIDYGLLLLPLLLIGLIRLSFPLMVAALLLPLLFSLFPFQLRPLAGKGRNWHVLPAHAVEWKAGLRKNGIVLVLLFLAACVLTGYPIVSLVMLWAIHAVVVSFYQYGEGPDILRAYGGSASAILRSKIATGCGGQLLLFFPVLLAYSILHPDQVLLPFLFLLLSSISLAASVLVKFSYLTPGGTSFAASMFQSLHILSIAIPFLVPVPLIVCLLKYHMAVQQLIKYGAHD